LMLLRTAQPTDSVAVAGIHVRSWQGGYRGLLPDEYLDALRPEDRAKHYTFGDPDPLKPTTIVAIEAGGICGFATVGPSRDRDDEGGGELWGLYVDPDRWGIGIGRALIEAARGRLAHRGYESASLWILSGNRRAERFYLIDGWEPDGTRRQDQIAGLTVTEDRYRRSLS
jgi:GNAT superfamily N-acetyltransferase